MGILKTKPKVYSPGDAITANEINYVVETVFKANEKAENVAADLQTAKTKAMEAVEIAQNALEKCGRDAVLVTTQGLFGFQVQDGSLMLNYIDETAPNLSIDENGTLIFNY